MSLTGSALQATNALTTSHDQTRHFSFARASLCGGTAFLTSDSDSRLRSRAHSLVPVDAVR